MKKDGSFLVEKEKELPNEILYQRERMGNYFFKITKNKKYSHN
jgi:hypothetical protein